MFGRNERWKGSNLGKTADFSFSLVKYFSYALIKGDLLRSLFTKAIDFVMLALGRIRNDFSATATATQEVDATIGEMAKNVAHINEEVQKMVLQNETMYEVLGRRVVEIEGYARRIMEVVNSIKAIGDSARKIGEVLSVISDIAE